tara:strand:- start:1426 stop:1566 length:141 start_codon:yes stop_codon:yes gene_type:complete
MNDNEIGEIQDVIGILGSNNCDCLNFECAERLYKLIKPYLDEEQTK